jgi:hypothetical protein
MSAMEAADAIPSMLPAVLWWTRQGIPVFPLWWPIGSACACPTRNCEHPGKHPLTSSGFKDATTDEDQVRTWWAKWPSANIGVPTGTAFDVVDIDGAAGAWAEFILTAGEPEHRAAVMSGRATGGFHLYCFPGGQKTVPSGKRGLPKGVEIKGIGGYVVVPPSMHASGRAYQWVKPLDEGVIHGSIPWPDWFARVTAEPDRPRVEITPIGPPATPDRASRYGAAVLRKACDAVTSVGPDGGRWLALALEAVPLAARAVAGGCLDRAEAVRALEQAAAQSGLAPSEVDRVPELFATIEAQGITDPIAPGPDPEAAIDSWLSSLPTTSLPAAYVEARKEEQRERTSWWPRDLGAVLSGDDPEPLPAFLARNDGHRLLYPAKVNGIIGESESGKTWVALLAVLQVIDVGGTVIYLDFEDTAAGIVSRLRLMGATDSRLTRLTYIGPDESLHAAATLDLSQTLTDIDPDLIVLDGFNAAMTLLGLDLNSNTDATQFSQRLLKPLARTGACLVYVDHVPKNKDARGKGGIGAQAKRAMTTGCAISVEVSEPFGRGMTGRLRLTVDKDRPGHVRAVSGGAKYAGDAILTSSDDGSVIVQVVAPDLRPADERGPWRPTFYMQKVSEFLSDFPDGVPKATVEEGVEGKAEHIRKALSILVEEGYVKRTAGPRGALIHTLERSYDETCDDLAGEL